MTLASPAMPESLKSLKMPAPTSPQRADSDLGILEEALQFVNGVRREFGLDAIYELLPGQQLDSEECPLARSICANSDLRTIVGPSLVIIKNGDVSTYRLDPAVTPFVRNFDLGRYPELIE
jgi:hypothetical protein